MTGVHRSEAWLQAQLKRTGKQIAEGAVQAMEREVGKSTTRRVTGGKRGNSAVLKPNPPVKRGMNGLETAYAQHLELRKLAGEVLWWRFNSMRLKLGEGAWFKPDFAVQIDGFPYSREVLQFHEVKGHMREAANVRLKVAADLYPFKFFLVRATDRRRLSWDIREIENAR